MVLLLVHGDFRIDFHVFSHCTVSYRFWLTLRTLCTWTRTHVLRSTLTLSCSSFDDVVFTLMFVLNGLFYFLIVCHTMFCSVRHTRVAMSAICILDWFILFLLGFFTFCCCCWSDWRRRERFYIEFQCVDCELVIEYCTWMCFLAKQLAREPKRLETSLGWDFTAGSNRGMKTIDSKRQHSQRREVVCLPENTASRSLGLSHCSSVLETSKVVVHNTEPSSPGLY